MREIFVRIVFFFFFFVVFLLFAQKNQNKKSLNKISIKK